MVLRCLISFDQGALHFYFAWALHIVQSGLLEMEVLSHHLGTQKPKSKSFQDRRNTNSTFLPTLLPQIFLENGRYGSSCPSHHSTHAAYSWPRPEIYRAVAKPSISYLETNRLKKTHRGISWYHDILSNQHSQVWLIKKKIERSTARFLLF